MSRETWLDEGLRVLAEEGAPGLRIDRIAARLGLSKGSFFHHFTGIAGYRQALLEHWEKDAVVELDEADPQVLLAKLAADVHNLVDLRLEVAIRAWALQDPAAAAVQERVDRARLSNLESIWSRIIVSDPGRAHTAALLPHLLLIGASVALPPLSREDLRAAFAMLAELIPAVEPISRHREVGDPE